MNPPRQRAERLDAYAERTDRAHDAGPPGRRLARQLGSRLVDLLRVVGQSVAAELDGIGAEGVGLDDLGAGPHVGFVHLAHELRLLEVQLVIADVQEEALGVEHRAHRAVEHVDFSVVQEIAQRGGHPLSVIRYPLSVVRCPSSVTRKNKTRLAE